MPAPQRRLIERMQAGPHDRKIQQLLLEHERVRIEAVQLLKELPAENKTAPMQQHVLRPSVVKISVQTGIQPDLFLFQEAVSRQRSDRPLKRRELPLPCIRGRWTALPFLRTKRRRPAGKSNMKRPLTDLLSQEMQD